MKLLNLFTFVCILNLTYACQAPVSNKNETTDSFNKNLAFKLKVDQYGMSRYVMAFLKKVFNRSQDSVTAAGLPKAHMENITRMAEENTLVLTEPFLDDGDIRASIFLM